MPITIGKREQKASRKTSFFCLKPIDLYLVYILYSQKLSKFYIGMTSNFDVRLDFHLNDIQQRKFTHNPRDWILYHKIECNSKTTALQIERHIKAMKSKVYIENLIKYPEITQKLLEKYHTC